MAGSGRAAFIRANLSVSAVPGCPALCLYTARPDSGLGLLATEAPPFWAWPWPGGLALACHIGERPENVRGMRVLDLGAGSGLVAVAAARAGAARVVASDTDAYARSAIRLNAKVNGVQVTTRAPDLLDGPAPAVDVICAGDVFYEDALAARAMAFLRRARGRGISVLLGDVGRNSFSREGLRKVAEYPVQDVGDGPETPPARGGVYTF